jgi:hypothetical protein
VKLLVQNLFSHFIRTEITVNTLSSIDTETLGNLRQTWLKVRFSLSRLIKPFWSERYGAREIISRTTYVETLSYGVSLAVKMLYFLFAT